MFNQFISNGSPLISTRHFGVLSVRGLNLFPNPADNSSAFKLFFLINLPNSYKILLKNDDGNSQRLLIFINSNSFKFAYFAFKLFTFLISLMPCPVLV